MFATSWYMTNEVVGVGTIIRPFVGITTAVGVEQATKAIENATLQKGIIREAFNIILLMTSQLTAGVTGAGVGADFVLEHEKLEARKMLAVGAAESLAFSARCVRRSFTKTFSFIT